MKQYFLSMLIILLLTGCSAKWHLKQSLRHERIAMQKGAEIRPDTVYKDLPVFIREIRQDTLFVTHPGDTITISKDRLKVVYIDLPGDSVWIQAACIADTVILKVPVKVEKVIYAPDKGLKWWHFVLIGFFGAVALYFIIRK